MSPDNLKKQPTVHSWWRNLLVGLVRWTVAAALVLAIGEFVARAVVTTPSNQQFDPELGWTYIPNSTIFSSREGGAHLAVNRLGANDEEFVPKGNRERLLFLGDSITEALQVPRHQNFTSVLEQLQPDVDAINMGRSAMGPVHYPVMVKRHKAEIEPAQVIVVLSPGDLLDTLQPSVVLSPHRDEQKQTIGLAPAMNDRIKEKLAPVLRRSALATHLARRLKPVLTQSVKEALCWIRDCPPVDASETLDQTYAEHHQVEAARRLRLALEAIQKQTTVTVVYVPALNYKVGRVVEPQYPWEGTNYRDVCHALGIPFLDTSEALAQAYRETGQPGHGFPNAVVGQGHLNKLGHAAVAQAIHGWLQTLPAENSDEESTP